MERRGNSAQPILFRRAELREVVDLRHAVLRQGLPREAAIFEGDEAETSRHYGAFLNGSAVGCATLHASTWEGEPAWQLRGMATDAAVRRRGVGRGLLTLLENDLADAPIRLLWCNARLIAIGFYEAMGWTIQSERFEIPTAGPHHRMAKRM